MLNQILKIAGKVLGVGAGVGIALGCVTWRDVAATRGMIQTTTDFNYKTLFVYSQGVFPHGYVSAREIYNTAEKMALERGAKESGLLEYEIAKAIKEIAGEDGIVTEPELAQHR